MDAIELNQREKEILTKIASGLGVDETAKDLNISTHTVLHYLKQVNRKLNTTNRTHAVAKAIRLGLIDI